MSEDPYRPLNANPDVRRQALSGNRRWYLRPSVALIAAMLWFAAAVLLQGVLKRVYGDLDDFPRVQMISLNLMVILLLASVASFFAAPILFILDRRNRSHGDDPAPKRRWFRFTLRSLFVTVTLACVFSGWLVWNLRQMRHRVETAKGIELRGGSVEWGWIYDSDLKSVPSLWRLMGAEPMFIVDLPSAVFTKQEAKTIRETFPEALVYRVEPGWDVGDDVEQ